jgi:(R,R)-butanediol dehydrogenase/meso-butanediol dehydrogenase/diacetyl reductase
MRAIRWHARLDVRVEDVAPPKAPAPGEVQIEVLSCGICGTDTEEYRHGPMFVQAGSPHPLTGRQAPLVIGHEVCGRVVATSDRGGDALGGRLVAVDGLISCGRCRQCRRHRVNLCEQLASIGFSADGGLAPLMNAPARGCLPLPEAVGADAGALAETLAVGVRALRRGRFERGEDVAIFGAGAVGLLVAQASRALGAGQVSIIEPDPARRELAASLGVEIVLEPSSAGEIAADVVLECSGAAAAVESAVRAARAAGRVVVLGITLAQLVVPVLDLVRGEREVMGSLSHVYDEDFATAVELIASGGIETDPLVEVTDDLDVARRRIIEPEAGDSAGVKLVVHPPGAKNALEPGSSSGTADGLK